MSRNSITSNDRRQEAANNNSINSTPFGFTEQVVSVTDLISEGPIGGLVRGGDSIYLNNDPIFSDEEVGYVSEDSTDVVSAFNNSTIINGFSNSRDLSIYSGGFLLIQDILSYSNLSVHSYTRTGLSYSITLEGFSSLPPSWTKNINTRINSENLSNQTAFCSFSIGGDYGFSEAYIIDLDSVNNRVTVALKGFAFTYQNLDEIIAEDPGAASLSISAFFEIDTVSGSTVTLASALPVGFQNKQYALTKPGIEAANIADLKKYSSSAYQFRPGTLNQEPIQSLRGAAGTTTIALASNITLPLGFDQLITTQNITGAQASEVDLVDLVFRYPSGLYLTNTNKGGRESAGAGYLIEIAIDRGAGYSAFEKVKGNFQLNSQLFSELSANWPSGSGSFPAAAGDYIFAHGGKFTSAVSFSHTINLEPYQPFNNFQLKITRLTNSENATGDAKGRGHRWPGLTWRGDNVGKWQAVQSSVISQALGVIKEKLNYPYSAVGHVTFNAKDFSSMPTRTYECYGMKVRIPNNYTPTTKTSFDTKYSLNTLYSGIWDGDWKRDAQGNVELTYTHNPAWIFYDILVNNRYGLGAFLKEIDIDKYSLYKIARYCDEPVPNGKGGWEPRFTANLYLTKATDAYKVLKDMATIFRGMLYWADGKLFPVIDEKKAPVYNFSRANVEDGKFNYEGTGTKTRVNQVIVTWNNPDSDYKLEPILVEDRENIIKTGRIIKETAVAFGCTSQGQAIRYGRWKLWTSVNQTEIVTFKTAINAAFLAPGDIINIQDSHDFSIRNSGRVSSAYTEGGVTEVVLDSELPSIQGTQTLSVVVPVTSLTLSQEIEWNGYKRGDTIPLSALGLNTSSSESDIQTAIAEAGASIQYNQATSIINAEITAISTVNGISTVSLDRDISVDENIAYDLLKGQIWAVKIDNDGPVLSSYKEYKILSISEENDNSYGITAVEYYESKFDVIDSDFTLALPSPGEPSVEVPGVTNAYILRTPKYDTPGEEFILSWELPDNEYITAVEIRHDVPNVENPLVISTTETSYNFTSVSDGEYTFYLRTKTGKGKQSKPFKVVTEIDDYFGGSVERIYGLTKGGLASHGIGINVSEGGQDRELYFALDTTKEQLLIANTSDVEGTLSGISLPVFVLSMMYSRLDSLSGIGTVPIREWDPSTVYEPSYGENNSYPIESPVAAIYQDVVYYALQDHVNKVPGAPGSEKYWYRTNPKDDLLVLQDNTFYYEPNTDEIFNQLVTVGDSVYIMARLSGSGAGELLAVNYNSKFDVWYDVGFLNWPARSSYIWGGVTNGIQQINPEDLWQPLGGITVSGSAGSNKITSTNITTPNFNIDNSSYFVNITETLYINYTTYKVAYRTPTEIYLDRPLEENYNGQLRVARLRVDYTKDLLVGKIVAGDTFVNYMTIDPTLSLGAREVILDSDTPFVSFDTLEDGVKVPVESTPAQITFKAQAIGFDSPVYDLRYVQNGLGFNVALPETTQAPNNGTRYDYIVHSDPVGGESSSLTYGGITEIEVVVTEAYAIGDVTKRAVGTFKFIPIGNGAFGEDGRVARLDAEDYSIVYDNEGKNPQFNNETQDNDIDLTVTTNVPTPLFRFTGASGTSDWTENSTNFYSVPSEMTAAFGPLGGSVVISVDVAIAPETWPGSSVVPEENIVAGDAISIIAVYAGGDAIAVSMPNDSHSISCNDQGIPFVNVDDGPVHTTPAPGSGTPIEVFKGGTALQYTETSPPDPGKFTVSVGGNPDIVPGTIDSSYEGSTFPIVSDHVFLSSSEDNEILEYTITVGVAAVGSAALNSTQVIRKFQTFSKAKGGSLGASSSLVLLYKASVNTPADYSGNPVEVDMTTGQVISDTDPALPDYYTDGDQGWYLSVNSLDTSADSAVSPRKRVWVIAATANSIESTDIIQSAEFTSPIEFSGQDGINTAIVELFLRTATKDELNPPSVPSGTLQYTFSTASLTGDLEGWSQTVFEPTEAEPYIWRISAAAISQGTAADIPTDDWSEPKNINTWIQGSAGQDAKAVKLTSDDYSIVYTPNGSGGFTPSPAGSATLTAVAQNFESPLYKITGGGDGVTIGVADDGGYALENSTSSFVIPVNPADWNNVNPYTVRVSVSEAAAPNTEVAFDTISIFKVAEGEDGDDGIDGYTVIITNSAHTIPSDFNGNNADYTGSGTSIEIYRGATQLTYGTGADTFSVGTPAVANIDFGGVSSTAGGVYTTNDHSNITNDTASIEYPLTIEDVAVGSVKQTFSLSKAGQTGQSTNVVFKRVAVTDPDPTAPASSIGVPSGEGWFDNPPDEETDGSTQLWASAGVKPVGASTFTWQTPYIVQSVNAVEVYAYREGSNVRNDTGTYNFTTNTLTPPTDWNLNPPASISSGTTVWVIAGTATGTPGATLAPIEWGDAVEYLKRQDGTSTNIVFRRSATNPGTPTTDTDGNGIPDNWFDSPPTGTDLLWASAGTYNPDTDTWTWGAPYQAEGTAVAEVAQYRLNSSAGGTTGGSYNFTTSTLTPSTSWSINPPSLANDGDVVYVVVGTAAGSPKATAAPITWGAPAVFATRVDGESITGPTGPRSTTGFVYYQTSSSTNPGTPSATSFNFSNSTFTGLTNGWGVNAPTFEAGNTNKYWYSRYAVVETTFGGSQNIGFSGAVQGIGFTGLVTFTSNTADKVEVSDGTNTLSFGSQGTTTIDGGQITTGQIDAQRINVGQINVTQTFNYEAPPTDTGQLTNGAGYQTQAFTQPAQINVTQTNNYAAPPTDTGQLTNGAGYQTQAFTQPGQINVTQTNNYVAPPTVISQLTNDSNYQSGLTSLAQFSNATTQFQTGLSQLSQFTNDQNFQNAAFTQPGQINITQTDNYVAPPTNTSQLTNDSGFATNAIEFSATAISGGKIGLSTLGLVIADNNISVTANNSIILDTTGGNNRITIYDGTTPRVILGKL